MNSKIIRDLVRLALKEDLGKGDVTTNLLIDPNQRCKAKILIKEKATVCGVDFMRATFKQLDPSCRFSVKRKDGSHIKGRAVIATVKGKARALLTGERVALNFLGHLSGIATCTQQFVHQAGRRCQILETRKTTPGLRFPEKYAVYCGGGHNHRLDLHEMLIIKDNHRELCKGRLSIPEIIQKARKKTRKKIVMEVDSLSQYKQALTAKPDIILLDNMNTAQLKKAVQLRNKEKGRRVLLESSGGVNLNTVGKIAQTGVDRISVGALTHSPTSVDVSMEIIL